MTCFRCIYHTLHSAHLITFSPSCLLYPSFHCFSLHFLFQLLLWPLLAILFSPPSSRPSLPSLYLPSYLSLRPFSPSLRPFSLFLSLHLLFLSPLRRESSPMLRNRRYAWTTQTATPTMQILMAMRWIVTSCRCVWAGESFLIRYLILLLQLCCVSLVLILFYFYF